MIVPTKNSRHLIFVIPRNQSAAGAYPVNTRNAIVDRSAWLTNRFSHPMNR
jgi:hypothetical protein